MFSPTSSALPPITIIIYFDNLQRSTASIQRLHHKVESLRRLSSRLKAKKINDDFAHLRITLDSKIESNRKTSKTRESKYQCES